MPEVEQQQHPLSVCLVPHLVVIAVVENHALAWCLRTWGTCAGRSSNTSSKHHGKRKKKETATAPAGLLHSALGPRTENTHTTGMHTLRLEGHAISYRMQLCRVLIETLAAVGLLTIHITSILACRFETLWRICMVQMQHRKRVLDS